MQRLVCFFLNGTDRYRLRPVIVGDRFCGEAFELRAVLPGGGGFGLMIHSEAGVEAYREKIHRKASGDYEDREEGSRQALGSPLPQPSFDSGGTVD
jgi:hypothetical protein